MNAISIQLNTETYSAFTLNGFDDQEQNLTFVKTEFQLLKLQFHACNFEQAFYSLHKLYGTSCDLDNSKYFYSIFFGTWLSNLHV